MIKISWKTKKYQQSDPQVEVNVKTYQSRQIQFLLPETS